MIRTLVVDDSNFIRFNIEQLFLNSKEISIVGTARNGIDALEFLRNNQVDVVLLDIFMPKMNGLETLAEIMKNYKIPTIMITVVDKSEHAELYFAALKLGAFDIISKPTGRDSLYLESLGSILKEKIKAAFSAKSKLSTFEKNYELTEELVNQGKKITEMIGLKDQQQVKDVQSVFEPVTILPSIDNRITSIRTPEQVPKGYIPMCNLLVIGASTGGPGMVIELLTKLDVKQNTVIVVVQHMPSTFTFHYAERLNTVTHHKFSEAKHGENLIPGRGYVAPGGFHMRFGILDGKLYCVLDEEEKVNALRPTIDFTLISGASIFKNRMYSVILTGMGNDGAMGVKFAKSLDGKNLAQKPEEALISSMPEKAIQTSCVDFILPVSEIATKLNKIL